MKGKGLSRSDYSFNNQRDEEHVVRKILSRREWGYCLPIVYVLEWQGWIV